MAEKAVPAAETLIPPRVRRARGFNVSVCGWLVRATMSSARPVFPSTIKKPRKAVPSSGKIPATRRATGGIIND